MYAAGKTTMLLRCLHLIMAKTEPGGADLSSLCLDAGRGSGAWLRISAGRVFGVKVRAVRSVVRVAVRRYQLGQLLRRKEGGGQGASGRRFSQLPAA